MELQDLLRIARERYPPGTKYINAATPQNTDRIFIIKGTGIQFWINEKYEKGEAIDEYFSDGLIYCRGKWAEIINEEKTDLERAREIIYKD